MRVAIVHYLPLEFYPPVTNLLDIVENGANQTHVFTTGNDKGRQVYTNEGVNIRRYKLPGKESSVKRLLKYFAFNFGVLFQLVRLRPQAILYYETYSAYPVYLYQKYFNRKVRVYIHCHEYFSPEWYSSSMRLVQLYHKKEKSFLYPRAVEISHTNQQRVDLFLKDNPNVDRKKMRVIENFPPSSWQNANKKESFSQTPLRCVYVGSLSTETTYVEQFCDWVAKQNGAIVFDIYSYNIHHDTKAYLQQLRCPQIKYYESGIEYSGIPALLRNYDVGIIFYKAVTLNIRYCAPNKLYEYLACGLDVWFSEELEGCYEFMDTKSSPRVIGVNFAALGHFDYRQAINREGLKEKNYGFTAAQALQPLVDELYKNKENTDAASYIQKTTPL